MSTVSTKTKIIILVIVVLLLAGGATYYFKQKAAKEKEEENAKKEVEQPKEPSTVDTKTIAIQHQKADASTSKKALEVADAINKPILA
jgi:flagellar basal body-associated protein FliL